MMNRIKTARVHLVKFLFVLPLLAVMLVAFRNSNGNWYKDITTDTIKKPDVPPPPPPPPADRVDKKDIPPPPPPSRQGAKPLPPPPPKLPKGAVSIEQEDDIIIITFKDGKKERYNLKKPAEKAALKKKYGEVITLGELPVADLIEVEVPKAGKPAMVAKPAIAEVAETQEVEVALVAVEEPIIRLSGNVSVNIVSEKDNPKLIADEIVIQGPVPVSKPTSASKPVYYVNAKRSEIQDAKALTEKFNISHAEIVSNPVVVKAQGEITAATIINLVTVENVKNKKAYIAPESAKLAESIKEVKPVNEKPAKEY